MTTKEYVMQEAIKVKDMADTMAKIELGPGMDAICQWSGKHFTVSIAFPGKHDPHKPTYDNGQKYAHACLGAILEPWAPAIAAQLRARLDALAKQAAEAVKAAAQGLLDDHGNS